MSDNTWKNLSTSLENIAILASDIEGVFVECGVFIGSTAKILASNSKNKDIYLFDSWEGLPEISKFDNSNFYVKGDWNTSMETAVYNLGNFKDKAHFKKGWFPDRFDEIKKLKISLLHLDCSLYESTKICLEKLWNQVSIGGYVVGNSHEGFSTGPEKAFREFFYDKKDIIEYPAGIMLVVK